MGVTVIVSFQARADKVDALLEFLTGLQPGVIEAGCQSITLLQDQGECDRIFEIEQWESAEQHQAMVQQAEVAGAFAPFAELLAAPFEVRYLHTVKASVR